MKGMRAFTLLIVFIGAAGGGAWLGLVAATLAGMVESRTTLLVDLLASLVAVGTLAVAAVFVRRTESRLTLLHLILVAVFAMLNAVAGSVPGRAVLDDLPRRAGDGGRNPSRPGVSGVRGLPGWGATGGLSGGGGDAYNHVAESAAGSGGSPIRNQTCPVTPDRTVDPRQKSPRGRQKPP